MTLVRTFRLALRALVLLGLAGCSDQVIGPPPICDVAPLPSPVPGVSQNSGLMKVGQPFTLLVPPSSPFSCGSGGVRPTSVMAEIEGPSGEPIEGQIQLGVDSSPATVPLIIAEKGGSFSSSLAAVAVWSAERRTLLFEHLDAEVASTQASPTFFWGVLPGNSSNTTRVRLRPRAPVP